MSKEKWYKSPWIISITTAVLSFLLTIGYDFLKKVPILTTTENILYWIFNIISSILNFNIKFWWLLVGFSLVVLIIFLINQNRNIEPPKPDFYNYKEGVLKKWKWSWDWEFESYEKKWAISNLKAHCPKCDTPMTDSSSNYFIMFDCPRCDFGVRDYECEEPHKIESIIIDNVNRKRKAPLTN